MGSSLSLSPRQPQGSSIEKTHAFCTKQGSGSCFSVFFARPFRKFVENNVFWEQWPSKTRRKTPILEFIYGAVVKNSSTTLVKHGIFKQLMSKTRRTMTFLRGKVSKTHRKMTLLRGNMSKTRRKMTLLKGKVWKAHRKTRFLREICLGYSPGIIQPQTELGSSNLPKAMPQSEGRIFH